MTWDQRERVLRQLIAKMNTARISETATVLPRISVPALAYGAEPRQAISPGRLAFTTSPAAQSPPTASSPLALAGPATSATSPGADASVARREDARSFFLTDLEDAGLETVLQGRAPPMASRGVTGPPRMRMSTPPRLLPAAQGALSSVS